MKKYFYSDGSNNFGPFTIEELKEKGITRETSIWFHELGEWKKAGTIQELNELFALTPPPIVKLTNNNQQTIQVNNSNNTIDILVFLSIAYWFFMDLINIVIRKFVDNWYESNFKYFLIGIGLVFAVTPVIFAFSIRNITLKIVAIILCALISISIIYNNIDWLIEILKYNN